MPEPLVVFVGFDARQQRAWRACRESLLARTRAPVLVRPLVRSALTHAGLYRRPWRIEAGQEIDLTDGRPFATAFAFSRFLVPALCQWRGQALFCDSDFLWRADVAELFDLADPGLAVSCVKHRHAPVETVKMRGQAQGRYPRKNWSSLVLWQAGHPANRRLTSERVNSAPGRWLHGFGWLEDAEIGELPEAWNWLEGHSDPTIPPKAVHYTRGTPDMPGHEHAAYAAEWWAAAGAAPAPVQSQSVIAGRHGRRSDPGATGGEPGLLRAAARRSQ